MVRATGLFLDTETFRESLRGSSDLSSSGVAAPAIPAATGFRRVVVALDGSRTAEHALPHALAIARRSDATIQLVHVFSMLDALGSGEQWYHHKVINRYRDEKHRYMDSVVTRMSVHFDSPLRSAVIHDIDIARGLASLSDAESLVIMATRGRGLASRLLKGSVTHGLIPSLRRPLLLVRGATTNVDLTHDPAPRQIPIPLDGTLCAEQVVSPAMQLGDLIDAHYTLVHLRDAGRMKSQSEVVAAREYLNDVARRARCGRRHVDTEVLVSERDFGTDFLRFAEKIGADCIALTTHTRPMWDRLFHRSVAKRVMRRSTMPLLMMHHAPEAGEECEQVLVESLWG
jgi:nucleotide-binding universal stress UspA family protein